MKILKSLALKAESQVVQVYILIVKVNNKESEDVKLLINVLLLKKMQL